MDDEGRTYDSAHHETRSAGNGSRRFSDRGYPVQGDKMRQDAVWYAGQELRFQSGIFYWSECVSCQNFPRPG